jgi:hypothetical protein
MAIILNENDVREHLIELAKQRKITGYKELAERFGQPYTNGNNDPKYIGGVGGRVSYAEYKENRPLLSVLVQDLQKKLPGIGFFELAEEFGLFTGNIHDVNDQKAYTRIELERVYTFWSGQFVESDIQEITELNMNFEASETPEQKERIVKVIERGTIGEKVKVRNQYRCQVCEYLGQEPLGFKKKDSTFTYIEAHHVVPVHKLEKGVLSARNIITVCANHHRQMHYGNVSILSESEADEFVFDIDGQEVRIIKIKLTDIRSDK